MPMSTRPRPSRAIGATAGLLLAVFQTGCDHAATGPRAAPPAQFSSDITLPDLQNHLGTGPARVDVRLVPGTLTARRLEIEEPEQLGRREEIRSAVTAISASGDQGTVTLALGGLQIGFTAATRFRPDDGDESQSAMALADFVARVQAALAAGRHPEIKAFREPPPSPQAPNDPTFVASELKLDEGGDHPLLRLNVTGANLATNTMPPPDAFLDVLGLRIALDVSGGTTKLQIENQELEGVREFEGIVQAVDQTAQTVTLKDGTIVRIVAGTEIEAKDGDRDDEHLTSLADVAAALAAGKTVKAEGRGLVETESPLTLAAIRIEFEVEEAAAPPAVGAVVEFRDAVTSVDVANATFTLAGGAVVSVTAHTVIDPEGDLVTLQGVADALAAHQAVRAEGHATVTALGPPLALAASEVKFETH
jgi:hypothetical protein